MKKNTENKKLAVYLIGGGISLVIIIAAIFVIMLVDFDAQNSTNNPIVIDDTNPVLEIAEESSRQASTQVGKSIEEVKESNDTISIDTEEDVEELASLGDDEIQEILEDDESVETSSTEENESEYLSFSMPVEGEVTKEYAKDKLVYSDTLKEWVTHPGIDIEAPKTSVVKAAEEGTIKSIKNDPRFGLTVVISHSNGFSTVYSNLLTAEFISVGEHVNKGQTIATVGNTASFEIADEPHLHFEILKDNVQIDPNMYIK